MERTITVKGTGAVSVRPDMTEVSISLDSLNKDYDKAMKIAAEKLESLQNALGAIGFQKQDLKTVSFNVSAKHDSIRDKNGNYKTVFLGYNCEQTLKLSFDFDTKVLSKVLSSIASCISVPELGIRFTVKDKNAVSQELLESAAKNARAKAEILTGASGVQLGELVRIDYNWGELNVYSQTQYAEDTDCMACPTSVNMDFEPDSIDVHDSATFVWTME